MNELLTAAKAVIKELDEKATWVLSVDNEDNLRAAVERTESDNVDKDADLFAVCIYGAKTERERIKEIIKAISIQGNSDDWFDACDRIMEKIDGE